MMKKKLLSLALAGMMVLGLAATAATPAAMHLLTAPPTAPQLLPPALRLSWAAPAP